MASSGDAGARVATAIGAIKWVLIGVAIVVAGVGVLRALMVDDGTYGVTVSVGIAAGALVWMLFVWVLFGWFEHTLTALVAIARNTAPSGMPSYEVPPAPYERRA
jgi:hypothetical protein